MESLTFLFSPLFSSEQAKKKSVNISPRIHVAYSVTLEKLTVYPLKNNVHDISSKPGGLTRARERERESYKRGKGRKRGWKFLKTRVKPTRLNETIVSRRKLLFFAISRKPVVDVIFTPGRDHRKLVPVTKLEKFIRDQMVDNRQCPVTKVRSREKQINRLPGKRTRGRAAHATSNKNEFSVNALLYFYTPLNKQRNSEI